MITTIETINRLHITPLECRVLGNILGYRHIAPLEQRGPFATIPKILEERRSLVLTKTCHEQAEETPKQPLRGLEGEKQRDFISISSLRDSGDYNFPLIREGIMVKYKGIFGSLRKELKK